MQGLGASGLGDPGAQTLGSRASTAMVGWAWWPGVESTLGSSWSLASALVHFHDPRQDQVWTRLRV